MSASFVLGDGDGDSSESGNEVSCLGPVSLLHLMWQATVWSSMDVQVPVDTLLNNGAHLALIRPDFVHDLNLPIRKLSKPLCIMLALQNTPTVIELSDYVVLSLSFLNNTWTSRPIHALVAPGLCAKILLGLPWLAHNNIVVDHSICSAVDKTCGFDLLNECVTPFLYERPRISPKRRRDDISRFHKNMVAELKLKCAERLSMLTKDNLFETVKEFDIIAAVKHSIEILASKEHLGSLEKNIKEEYKDIFEPIPHADLLPSTETACIQLKDSYKTIATHQYSIPHQFCEHFAKLIQKRLDSGFIHPSSSAHASPSFIVPKADPNTVLRWVCDHRQLNANTVPDNFPLPRVDDILADCAKGKIWATIDMTDSFFQTRVHPNDIHKTAITTPLGSYEWCIMPMGFQN